MCASCMTESTEIQTYQVDQFGDGREGGIFPFPITKQTCLTTDSTRPRGGLDVHLNNRIDVRQEEAQVPVQKDLEPN